MKQGHGMVRIQANVKDRIRELSEQTGWDQQDIVAAGVQAFEKMKTEDRACEISSARKWQRDARK